jgi:hypothetical protein
MDSWNLELENIFSLGSLQELYPHGGVQYYFRTGGARNTFSKLPRNGNQRQSNPTQVKKI